MNGDLVLDWGPWAAIALWLAQRAWQRVSAWQDRKWNKEDASEDKVAQLYERLIEQQRDTLAIIDRNTDALTAVRYAVDQMRIAFEKELPELISSVRDLTERTARMEKRLEHNERT